METRLAYELDIILLRVRGSASHGGDDCGGEDCLIESGEAA